MNTCPTEGNIPVEFCTCDESVIEIENRIAFNIRWAEHFEKIARLYPGENCLERADQFRARVEELKRRALDAGADAHLGVDYEVGYQTALDEYRLATIK